MKSTFKVHKAIRLGNGNQTRLTLHPIDPHEAGMLPGAAFEHSSEEPHSGDGKLFLIVSNQEQLAALAVGDYAQVTIEKMDRSGK